MRNRWRFFEVGDDGVGAEILLVRPPDPMVSRTYETEIGLICELTEGRPFHVRLDVKAARHAAAGEYPDPIVSPNLAPVNFVTS
jgi:hypothetical protein